MRALIQRVSHAAVSIEGAVRGRIGPGLVVLLGVAAVDTPDDADWLCRKIPRLRLFDDENGAMNRSLLEKGGELLVVSQFTLFGSVRKGNRPSFNEAAAPGPARALYEEFLRRLEREAARPVQSGVFGAEMQVSLTNDGPVTLLLDTRAP